MPTKIVTLFAENGDEMEVKLPAEWLICGQCDGEGKSSAYLGAFTSDEWHQQDEDFQRDYMAGEYDRPCAVCGGSGKCLHVRRDRCVTPEQKAALAQLDEAAEAAADDRACLRAEMRLMGDYS